MRTVETGSEICKIDRDTEFDKLLQSGKDNKVKIVKSLSETDVNQMIVDLHSMANKEDNNQMYVSNTIYYSEPEKSSGENISTKVKGKSFILVIKNYLENSLAIRIREITDIYIYTNLVLIFKSTSLSMYDDFRMQSFSF